MPPTYDQESAESMVSTLFGFVEAQGHADYIGEAVSQLEHSLQAAHFAKEAGYFKVMLFGIPNSL